MKGYKDSKYVGGYCCFGKVLRDIRKERKLKLPEISRLTNIDRKTISKYEYADGNYGEIKALLLLLIHYRIKPDVFWARVAEESKREYEQA